MASKYGKVQRVSPAPDVIEAAILRALGNGATLGKSDLMRAANIDARHVEAVSEVLYALRASGKLSQIGERRTAAYCLAKTPPSPKTPSASDDGVSLAFDE